MKKLAPLMLATFLAYSCTTGVGQEEQEEKSEPQTAAVAELSITAGLEMLQTNCYACHNPNTTSHDDMLAPPLAGIKNRYKNTYGTRDEFITAVSSFVSMPTEEKALMKGPIRRFGLMPKPALSDSAQIRALVAFIYDNPIETPEWFAEHYKEQHGEEWKGQ